MFDKFFINFILVEGLQLIYTALITEIYDVHEKTKTYLSTRDPDGIKHPSRSAHR
jgi:hypothetical protein